MRILCVFGQHNYGDPSRGEGYEYSSFLPAFHRLGHEVLFFESWNRTRYRSFYELNSALLQTVEESRPDVIFAVQFTYEIWLETWQLLRNLEGVATVNWTTDDSWKYAQFSRFVAPYFHAFTTTYAEALKRYHADGIQHVLLTQWAANAAQLQSPRPSSECSRAVSFVGTAHGRRHHWIEELRKRGIQVDCFGYGWPAGPVAAHEIPNIIRDSVISLNFASGAFTWDGLLPREINQIKARTFEVPGAGGFLLTEQADGLERCYVPGEEIIVFHDVTDLSDKIHYYLAHTAERDRIARAGYDRTRAEHTYDLRLREVLNFALARRDDYFAQADARPEKQLDVKAFEATARRHASGAVIRQTRRGLTALTKIAWGPKRGERAARRLVYELSWRLTGAMTYSAAGWPGRMFYGVS